MSKVILRDLGLIDYKDGWDYQEKLFNEVVSIKVKNRSNKAASESLVSSSGIQLPSSDFNLPTPNYLLFCEHPHVYTLGKSGSSNHLLLNTEQLNKKKASFYKINRGGDITYHGPGQIVGYPIFDLDNFFTDIHKYLRFLEESIIRTLAEFGITGERTPGQTGVWLDPEIPGKARKICAFGVRCSRWVTMHGFAFNVNTDLSYFQNIIPCGIANKGVTSLEKELGKKIDMFLVKEYIIKHLSGLFEFDLTPGQTHENFLPK